MDNPTCQISHKRKWDCECQRACESVWWSNHHRVSSRRSHFIATRISFAHHFFGFHSFIKSPAAAYVGR